LRCSCRWGLACLWGPSPIFWTHANLMIQCCFSVLRSELRAGRMGLAITAAAGTGIAANGPWARRSSPKMAGERRNKGGTDDTATTSDFFRAIANISSARITAGAGCSLWRFRRLGAMSTAGESPRMKQKRRNGQRAYVPDSLRGPFRRISQRRSELHYMCFDHGLWLDPPTFGAVTQIPPERTFAMKRAAVSYATAILSSTILGA